MLWFSVFFSDRIVTSRDHLIHLPVLKQGQLEQVAQDSVLLSFEYLPRWRLHSFSGQPLLVSDHPHRK